MLVFVVAKSSLFSPIILPNDGSSVVSAISVVSSGVGLCVVDDVDVIGVVDVLVDVISSVGGGKLTEVPFPIFNFKIY
jgi:hypothetical protein